MKRISFFTCLVIATATGFAQNFPGYSSGNHSGVNGVFSNPASVVDSRYRWNANVLSLHTGVANNNASFRLKNIGTAFDNLADSVLFGNNAENANGAVNMDLHGPSFRMAINNKSGFAVTTRFRTVANIVDIDGQFIRSIRDDISPSSLPLVLQSDQDQKIILNGWSDWGLSYGRVLVDKGTHFLKGGITVKYLSGSANSYLNINNLEGTLDASLSNVYLTDASVRVAIDVSGVDFSEDFDIGDAFRFEGSGVGADLGFSYEYRPADGVPGAYKFRAGIALLDIGSIRYKTDADQSGDYTISIPSPAQWDPTDLDDKSVSEIKDYLDASPYFINNAGTNSSYSASLPTSLQLTLDYVIANGFSLNLASQVNLIRKKSIYNSFYCSTLMLTPGYELRNFFGVYLPVSYNTVSRLNAGLSLRVGPVFIGSGSIWNALVDKSRQADFHFGIQFGKLYK